MATHKASFITIDDYEFPKGRNRVGVLVFPVLMALSARRKFIKPRSIIHDHLLARSAAATKYSQPVQDFIFYLLFGINGIQTIWFILTKLRKHNVKVLSVAWVQWVAVRGRHLRYETLG